MKLTKEDIEQFGTEDEKKVLNEDVYGYQGGRGDAGIDEQEAYDAGFKEGYKVGYKEGYKKGHKEGHFKK